MRNLFTKNTENVKGKEKETKVCHFCKSTMTPHKNMDGSTTWICIGCGFYATLLVMKKRTVIFDAGFIKVRTYNIMSG